MASPLDYAAWGLLTLIAAFLLHIWAMDDDKVAFVASLVMWFFIAIRVFILVGGSITIKIGGI
jgi:hypothetical protein